MRDGDLRERPGRGGRAGAIRAPADPVVVYLLVAQFGAQKRVAQAVADLFGVPISQGSVAAMTARAAHRLEGDFLAEIFFGIITRQAIRRGTFTSVPDLIGAIRAFIDGYNQRCAPFRWTKTADQILTKANRQKTSDTRH